MASALTLGGGAFGPNDRTTRSTGNPAASPSPKDQAAEDPSADETGVSPKTSRTRATSVTEAGVETPRHAEKGVEESDADIEAAETNRRASIVQSLARQYTNQSHAAGHHHHTGTVDDIFRGSDSQSPLNPNGEKFNAAQWAKAIVGMVTADGHQFRQTGVAFQHMNVFGFGEGTDYQKDVFNVWLGAFGSLKNLFGAGNKRRIDILRDFDGVVRNGEMLVVLGPPGSGCSTFLKTIAGEHNGINMDKDTYFNYQGMTAKEMHTHHRGEAIYTAEVDVHFPQLSVGDTLTFAANARAPRSLPEGIPRSMFATHLRDVVMAMFGITHTMNTRVGNEYIRGVSGGERKRVTIAEAALSGAPLQCWDNSTRGLDSANAIEFCKTLRLQTKLFQQTACVSIYQAPQSAYDLFDKAAVLYEGRQIFFGPANLAKQYFVNMGFHCPDRATTPDFLTSMTSPQERIVREGFAGRVPRTPDEFALAWKNSAEYTALQADIEEFKTNHPINGTDADAFRASKRAQQAKSQRAKSAFTLSYWQQIKLCLWRGWRRLIGDPSITVGSLIANTFMALIISSIFFNLQMTTSSFFQRGALLFFACLMNAFASALEILTLFAQRPIVEKHARYALYHPSAEAVASMLCDLPYKIGNCLVFNLTLYFMANLRREPGAFFFYLLMSFVTVLTMSMVFRTIASSARTLSQALVPAAVLILGLVIFTGFVIPIDYMLGWCRWMNYVDPMAYAFEAFMVNEFSGQQYECTEFIPRAEVPGYADVPELSRACAAIGSVPGQSFVDGDVYINTAFRYFAVNKWRNFGIMFAFMIGFMIIYMIAAELVSEKASKGEVLVFRRGHEPLAVKEAKKHDDETGTRVAGPVVDAGHKSGNESDGALIQKQTAVFHWQDVCYDVKIKKETRRILDHVDGWVKPGTLTALMGVSGAGKTTLLDCLADRTSMGVIYGDMFVDGHERDASFQRKTGYVQQQDLHLQTTTVREALKFSALLRQPGHVPEAEKLAYVEEVIKLLDMEEYADAVVGVPGEGLNVEQRKRLTIGVELVAKPPLLLFVDEPTSGLDSQTSWAILDLLEKLTKSGQAILCTIHQPSAMLFQRFDRLLFLQKGGKTVYFGEIGENSNVMVQYFEKHSGLKCPVEANPAEWMLECIGAAPGTYSNVDWFKTWRESDECTFVHEELERLKNEPKDTSAIDDKTSYNEFAAPFMVQMKQVVHRVFQQYWRTPSYIYSKATLCLLISLYIGFVFYNMPNTQQGLQNQMFAIFNILTIFGQLVQQTMPYFVIQRDLYEVRERPSKVYGWKVFMLSQIIVEIPWNTLMAVIMFVCWYYPVGLHRNAIEAGQVTERGGLMFLLMLGFLIFTSTFTDFIIAGFETAEAGANMANLLFMLCLLFCGVLARPETFPRFWIFMYRISPFTYLVSAMLSTALANTNVQCSANEFMRFNAPDGQTCMQYLQNYTAMAGGYLRDEGAQTNCEFCPIKDTNVFLAAVGSEYKDRWRNFGILWAFIIFNIFGALALYWLARVPKNKLGRKKADEAGVVKVSTLSKITSRASRASKTKEDAAHHGGVVEPLPKVDEKSNVIEPSAAVKQG